MAEEFEREVSITKLVRPEYASQYSPTIEAFGMMPLMTAEEVGRILSVPAKTVMNLARAGDMPRHKIGAKTVRFDLADVYEYRQKTKMVGGEEAEEEDEPA